MFELVVETPAALLNCLTGLIGYQLVVLYFPNKRQFGYALLIVIVSLFFSLYNCSGLDLNTTGGSRTGVVPDFTGNP